MSSTREDDVIPCPLCKQPLEMLLNGRALCRNAGNRQSPSDGCLLWLENAQLHIETWQALHSALQHREQEVREEERERAAKIAEGHAPEAPRRWNVDAANYGRIIAAAIRRDDTPPEGEQQK